MKRVNTFLIVASLLFFATVVNQPLRGQSRRKPVKRVATMFDEFGALRHCDVTARLDNFTVSLQNDPSLNGYLIIYGPPGDQRGAAPLIAEQLKGYLVNMRGIESDQISTIYGGRNDVLKELRVQLWIAPPGAAPPEPKKFDAKPELFKGLFDENKGYDEISYFPFDGEGEGESLFDGAWLAIFADVVKAQPNSLVYVVGYNGDVSVPGAWRRIAESQVEVLRKTGLDSRRFKTTYGGNQEEAKVQIWIQPASEPPPVKDAGTEPTPRVSLQLGDFGALELGNKEYERQAFTRLVESLRSFPNLRACVIVRVEQPTTTVEDETPQAQVVQLANEPDESLTEPVEPDPEPADLLKLVESWKSELAKLNIREDRLVILFSKALPDFAGSLETWLLPLGEPLPDPEAIFKEQEPASQPESKPNDEAVKKPQR